MIVMRDEQVTVVGGWVSQLIKNCSLVVIYVLAISTQGCSESSKVGSIVTPTTRTVRVGNLQLSVDRIFDVDKLGEKKWIVSRLAQNNNTLIIYQPFRKTWSPEKIEKRARKEQQVSRKHPGEVRRILRLLDRKIGRFFLRMVEGVTPDADKFTYAAFTSIDGHFLMMEIVLEGGIDHPKARAKLILQSIASLKYIMSA